MELVHRPSRYNIYRPELDGLRALAVVFVIINHFSNTLLPSGFLGVDIFFVLSGYVVSASLSKESTLPWHVFLTRFYSRRIRRIFPALIFCVLVTGILASLFLQNPNDSLTAGKYALIGLSNIYFYRHSNDYFGDDALYNVFTHTWSLGVEEQYYLLFPALLLIVGFKTRKWLALILATLTFLSFIYWIHTATTQPYFSFFSIVTRFWEIGLGCFTFVLTMHSKSAHLKKVGIWLSGIALTGIGLLVFLPKDALIIANAFMCLFVAIFIYSVQDAPMIIRLLSKTWIVRIGILSYSLYLWHWPVIVLSRHTVGVNKYTLVFQILLIFALSLFSYYCIECPFRNGKIVERLKIRTNLVLFGGLATICLSYLGILNLNKVHFLFAGDKNRFDTKPPIFSADPDLQQCRNADAFRSTIFPPPCFYSAGAKKTLWMAGDSTTWALKGFASEFALKEHFNIAMYADNSAFPSANLSCGNDRCNQNRSFFKKTFDYIMKWSNPGDIVLITTNLMEDFCNESELFCRYKGDQIAYVDGHNHSLSINQALQAFLTEMGALQKKLSKKQVYLVLSAPLPRWKRTHRIYCDRQWFKPGWQTSKCQSPSYEKQLKSRSRLLSLLHQAKNREGFMVYDPFSFFCTKKRCAYANKRTNENYWIDETHLSTLGGRVLAPHFESFLQKRGVLG